LNTSRTSAAPLVQAGIVVLTIATALIHLQLAFPDPVFILNGLGYLTLLAALYLPIPQLSSYRDTVRWGLVGYAALTIFLWILIGERTPIGFIDKAIEVALITLLLIDTRHRQGTSRS
jgi:hypothetical protein